MKVVRATSLALVLVVALALMPGAAFAESSVHEVQPGDTLARIAAQHGTSVAAIMRANGLANANRVYVGQRLIVSGSASAASTQSSSGGQPVYYYVKYGEYLAQIAARYGVSVSALVRANGLANPNRIYAGMRLVIPGAKSGTSGGSTGGSSTQGTRFVVSISQQHCWLYVKGALAGNWRCSTGRSGAPTLPGTYRIQSKIPAAYGASWGFYMPYWLGIYWAGRLENGIHGLPYYRNGARTWAGLVGTRITFGCVMLDDANARKLYNTAYIGMPVIVSR